MREGYCRRCRKAAGLTALVPIRTKAGRVVGYRHRQSCGEPKKSRPNIAGQLRRPVKPEEIVKFERHIMAAVNKDRYPAYE